jgi:hypothetical protein
MCWENEPGILEFMVHTHVKIAIITEDPVNIVQPKSNNASQKPTKRQRGNQVMG